MFVGEFSSKGKMAMWVVIGMCIVLMLSYLPRLLKGLKHALQWIWRVFTGRRFENMPVQECGQMGEKCTRLNWVNVA